MYIAFKWLICLSLTMWLSMCGIDMLVKKNIEIKQEEGFNHKMFEITMNTSIPVKRKVELERERYYWHVGDRVNGFAYLHCFMFLAGALVVSLYNKKNEIVLFIKRQLPEVDTNAVLETLQEFSKITANRTFVFTMKYGKILWEHVNYEIIKLWNKVCAMLMRKELQKPRINIILLKKLQEIGEERKNLGQLLIAAIHENKNIRMQYQLENMAKNRLVQHIENTQKVIKENRSRYVSFQQLYLVTHQENSFLKSRMNKIIKEKEEAEKNLLELLNEVYKSKNNELKCFCSRFIVRTTDNLLNSDVGLEIQKFLDKSRPSVASTSSWQFTERPDKVNSTCSLQKCANPRFAEIVQDDILVPLVSDAPKLKGLPGECVWTVKDKNGLIEKLYEYDYESDLDDGDTIRRIRQYSVYFDNDCLLDFSNSRTVINETRPAAASRITSRCGGVDYPSTSHGFLTGSEAFQNFMLNNKNMISNCTPRLPGPRLLSG